MTTEAKMTKTKKILPQEWIQDYYNPVIGVLSSPEVNALCHKNNLSMVEMLEPFARLTSDITIKDPEGINHAVPNLSLTFQDFAKDPSRDISPRLLSDTIASITEEPLVSRAFPNRSLQLEAPGFTPWFDAWTKLYLQSVPCVEHEFLRHHLGCVFVISSNAKEDPIEQLNGLVQQQRKMQHERTTAPGVSTAHPYPQYFTSNIFKYYILLHDVYAVEEARAHEIFRQMQNAFGSSSCHLLQFNSRTLQNDGDDANPNVADHWTSMTFTNRFSHIETRLKAVSGDNVLIPNNSVQPQQPAAPVKNHDAVDHPLAPTEEKSPPPSPSVVVPKLVPVTKENIAIYLTYNDVDRIRILIREFVIKCLVPHCERQLRLLHEIVTNRKSRSLFSGAKRWFGQSKPGVATGTSVIYGREAPELQLRKMADLYFMLKLYKHAYNHYHTAKKDFYSDEAWNYYAGAAEMCALAQFMQGDSLGKKYPAHYMEDSITKYLQVCQMPEFAIRASLFDALCLKYQGMFQESALSYVRIVHEAKDLRSSLLLEQAAYCYLMCNPPMVRKYAFHIILSGYRFSKSGQKKHSSRAYRQGFQVYKGRGLELAENHILYTLGHQSLLLKDHYTAASLFNELVATTHPGMNPLQQMCHLREFFIVHHMREKEDKAAATITIPFFQAQDCLLDLTGESKAYEALYKEVQGSSWQDMERTMVEAVYGSENVHLSQTCQNLFGPLSHNLLMPQVAVGEPIRLLVPVRNPFQTPLLMRKLRLIWKFTPLNDPNGENSFYSNNDEEEAANCVKVEPIDSLKVEKDAPLIVDLRLVPLKPGELLIHGIEYSLKAVFPQSESTDYTIRGKQPLKVQGPRLNSTKEQKSSKTPLYMKDTRLSCQVVPRQPRLKVTWTVPETMLQGEIQPLSLTLENVGNAPLSNLHLINHLVGSLAFSSDKAKKTLFDLPLVRENAKLDALGAEISQGALMDILPVHVDLEPGASIKRKLFMCAPSSVGTNEIPVHFSYSLPSGIEKKPLIRLLKKTLTTKVLPALSLKASKVNSCLHDDSQSQALMISLSNGSGQESKSLDPAYVRQVSLISSSKVLVKILSTNESASIPRGESLMLSLMTSRSEMSDFGFSTLQVAEDKEFAQLDVAPYVNFIKGAFEFPPKQGPKPKGDIMAVIWQASGGRSGLIYSLVKEEEIGCDQVDGGGGTDAFSLTESIDMPAVPATKVPARVGVHLPDKNLQHDFDVDPICLVPFELRVENLSSDEAILRYKTETREFMQPHGRFLGCTKATVPLEGKTKRALSFHLAVSAPGLYSYGGLGFQVTHPGQECDDDEFIPLEVNFVVQ